MCIFCDRTDYVFENQFSYAVFDNYPVSKGHMLIIPKRHFESWFDASYDEYLDILDLIDKCKKYTDDYYSPDGYNIGINVGQAAGQTVMHLHTHLIPRYLGDLEDPRGGVRGVIPDKRIYHA